MPTRTLPIALTLAALVVTACSGGDKIVSANGSTPAQVVLSAADSAYLANLVANQAITNFKNLRVMQAVNLAGSLPAGCQPTLSGTGDTNGNQIAEDQTLTFTTQTCTFTQSGTTTRVSGSIRVQDLGGVRGYRVTYNTLTEVATLADTTVTFTLNGAYEAQWTVATSGRTLLGVTTTISRQERTGTSAVTFTPNMSGIFAPTGNGQIAVGRNLPAGTFTLSGTLATVLTFSGSLRPTGAPASLTYNVAVSTPVTMAYDGACTQDRAFAAGQLRGAVSGYAPGALTSAFAGCGQGVTPPPNVKR